VRAAASAVRRRRSQPLRVGLELAELADHHNQVGVVTAAGVPPAADFELHALDGETVRIMPTSRR
jgi:hypothetical protein